MSNAPHTMQERAASAGWLTGVGVIKRAELPARANTRFRDRCAFFLTPDPFSRPLNYAHTSRFAIHDSRITPLLTHPESTGRGTDRRNPSHIGASAPGNTFSHISYGSWRWKRSGTGPGLCRSSTSCCCRTRPCTRRSARCKTDMRPSRPWRYGRPDRRILCPGSVHARPSISQLNAG